MGMGQKAWLVIVWGWCWLLLGIGPLGQQPSPVQPSLVEQLVADVAVDQVGVGGDLEPPSQLPLVPLVEPPANMALLAEQAWLSAGICPVQVLGIVAGDAIASRIAYMLHRGERIAGHIGGQVQLGTGVAVINAIDERNVRLSYQGQELSCPLQWR